MLLEQVDLFIKVVNAIGLFAFAVSGAVAAIKHKADLVGVLLLSLVASSCGGICRDILIGDLPPAMMRSHLPLVISISAGLLTRFYYPIINKLSNPMEFFDAFGLGLFAVLGANKGMNAGISPEWCVGLGILTAVGGGIVRDMLLAQVPTVLKTEIYATAALLGALIMVIGKIWLPQYEEYVLVVGALACVSLRLLALRYRWHMRTS